MAEHGDFPGGVDLKLAYEYYTIAAAHGSAQAFFNLARLYYLKYIKSYID